MRARLEAAVAIDAPTRPDHMTITALVSLYRAHCVKRYNGRHGIREVNTVRQSLTPFETLYGSVAPDEIKPLNVLACRQLWIEQGLARTTIQARMQRVRLCWRWGRRRELITSDLPEVDPLPFGHAVDRDEVKPVSMTLVEQTLATAGKRGGLSPIAGIMLRVIALTAMRPGECCDLHSSALDRSSRTMWVFRPGLHKTRWKGCVREVFIGPQAQEILGPVLRPGWIFLTRHRRPWRETSLYSNVRNACIANRLPHWFPNQLRHTAATMIREEMGLDAAQAVLGHSRISTTQVYAERQQKLASAAMLRFG